MEEIFGEEDLQLEAAAEELAAADDTFEDKIKLDMAIDAGAEAKVEDSMEAEADANINWRISGVQKVWQKTKDPKVKEEANQLLKDLNRYKLQMHLARQETKRITFRPDFAAQMQSEAGEHLRAEFKKMQERKASVEDDRKTTRFAARAAAREKFM